MTLIIECEFCHKKVKKKGSIGLVVGNTILPFRVCSYDCLTMYSKELERFSSDIESGEES